MYKSMYNIYSYIECLHVYSCDRFEVSKTKVEGCGKVKTDTKA